MDVLQDRVGVQHGLGMFDPDLGALSENSFVLNFPFGLDHLTSQVVQVLFVSVVEMIEFLRLFEAFLTFAHDFLGGQLELQKRPKSINNRNQKNSHEIKRNQMESRASEKINANRKKSEEIERTKHGRHLSDFLK